MSELAGTWKLGSEMEVRRMGFGAMRLCGPMVYGPPRDPEEAARVLRAAVEAGVNHIDTSDYYGPHVTNLLIRETLAPYRKDLVIVTKVGNKRAPDKSWPVARSEEEIRSAVEDNLRNLGVEALDVVNLRMGGPAGPLEESLADEFEVLGELKVQGKIKHLGLSNITAKQLQEGLEIDDVVCVQNSFGLTDRADKALVKICAEQEIAYVPFFPLGGGRTPLRLPELDAVAAEVGGSTFAVALAWLLQYSPNILLIPGTSKVAHLRENLRAAELVLSAEQMVRLSG